MSEENTPAPRQGLGVWIMSGSMALVMVIGGALAVNSGDKSVEEGNPTSTRTVAPGGGHTLDAAEPEDSADRLAIDETGAVGVLGVQLTEAGLAGRPSRSEQTVAPVLVSRVSGPGPAQAAQRQTARTDVGGAKRGQSRNTPAASEPGAPDTDTATETAAGTSDQVEILRSETGEELQVRFAVPAAPGSYASPVSVDGTQFVVHVRVGEDGRVTVPSFDGTATPYHHDPVSGRLTVTVVPADLGSSEPVFAADAPIDTTAVKTHAVSVLPVDRHRSADEFKPAEVADHVEQEEDFDRQGDVERQQDVERDQGVEQEQAGAIETWADPTTVRESSNPAAPTTSASSSSLDHAQTETEQTEPELSQPELSQPESIESEETLGQATSSEPAAPQRAQVQPGPIVTGAVQSRQTKSHVGSTQAGTTPSKKPNPLVQTRPSKATPRSTVTATDPAESVSSTSTPIP